MIPFFCFLSKKKKTPRYACGTSRLYEEDFKTYPGMAHSACQEEFQHLANFISARLKL